MFFDLLADSDVSPLVFCGLLAGVLSTIAYVPYMADTVMGRTQPERATWLIWSVVASVAMGSQIYEGANQSLWFVGVQVSATIVIFLMSIKRGAGAYLSRRNINLFGVTLVGLLIWYLAENAMVMLLITTSISILGGSVTVIKAYRDPESETLNTWVLSLAAAFFAVISVGTFDPALLIYPVYLYVLYATIVLAILLGRLHGNVRKPEAVAPPIGALAPLLLTAPAATAPAVAAARVMVDVGQVHQGVQDREGFH